jgi:hypothetical protein
LHWLWMSQKKKIPFMILQDFNMWSIMNFLKKLNPLKWIFPRLDFVLIADTISVQVVDHAHADKSSFLIRFPGNLLISRLPFLLLIKPVFH